MAKSIDDLEYENLGQRLALEGQLLIRDLRCWMVPHGTEPVLASQSTGVLIVHPGLGAAVISSCLMRVGGPVGIVDRTSVIGRIVPSSVKPFPWQLFNVEKVLLDREVEVDIEQCGKVSTEAIDEMLLIADYSFNDKVRMLQKYVNNTSAW